MDDQVANRGRAIDRFQGFKGIWQFAAAASAGRFSEGCVIRQRFIGRFVRVAEGHGKWKPTFAANARNAEADIHHVSSRPVNVASQLLYLFGIRRTVSKP